MTPGWFTSTCLAVSSADAAIRRVGELGPYRLEADSRQKIKNKNKNKILLVFGIGCETAYVYVMM